MKHSSILTAIACSLALSVIAQSIQNESDILRGLRGTWLQTPNSEDSSANPLPDAPQMIFKGDGTWNEIHFAGGKTSYVLQGKWEVRLSHVKITILKDSRAPDALPSEVVYLVDALFGLNPPQRQTMLFTQIRPTPSKAPSSISWLKKAE